MRSIVKTFVSLAVSMSAPGVYASGLVPEQPLFGTQTVICYPLVEIGFTFDVAVEVLENSVATVYSDGQAMAIGVLTATNYLGPGATQGIAVIKFDEPLLLPKGKRYRVVVPEDVIFKANNRNISNDELTEEFEVPADLGPAIPTIDEGQIIKEAGRIGFYFGFETAPVEGGGITLYREGVPVRTYPCVVSWDWDLGYAGVNFGKSINFEAGVRYTLTLSEESVSALYRPDITNKEASVSFIGGYTEPVKQVHYVWCSLFDHHPSDVLGEVRFFYDQPVELSVNPRVLLCLDGENTVVKEVVPTLAQEDGQYVMTADFEETPLADGKGYTIVIPEGTLVTEAGVFVNSRNETEVITSGISDVAAGGADIRTEGGAIAIDNVPDGSEVILYSPGGSVLYKSVSSSGSVTIPAAGTGIYLLTINGKAYKIAVKQ